MLSSIRSLRHVAFWSVASLVLHAQVVGGSIGGVVTDPSGALVPGAHVLLRSEETGAQRDLTTDGAGGFVASSVQAGSYTLSVAAEGFAHSVRKGVTLTVGQSLALSLSLSVAGSDSVDVQSAPPTVNTTTEQTSGLVDAHQVKELPLNGRSYDQLLTLNPGAVNYTNQRSGGTGTSNSSVGSMFAISGRRPQDNLFLLNGIEYTGASLINVTPGGTSGQLLGIDGIREFNVVTDTTPPLTASATERRYPSSPQRAPTHSMARYSSSAATASSTRATTSTERAFRSSSATISARRLAARCTGTRPSSLRTTRATGRTSASHW